MNFTDIVFKTMTYRKLIAHCLKTRLEDAGMTQSALAKNLGFTGTGNIISMHLAPDSRTSAFPVARLAALKRECGLDWYACLVLLHKRAINHGAGTTRMDRESMHFVLHCGAHAAADFKACGYGKTGVLHGC